MITLSILLEFNIFIWLTLTWDCSIAGRQGLDSETQTQYTLLDVWWLTAVWSVCTLFDLHWVWQGCKCVYIGSRVVIAHPPRERDGRSVNGGNSTFVWSSPGPGLNPLWKWTHPPLIPFVYRFKQNTCLLANHTPQEEEQHNATYEKRPFMHWESGCQCSV